MKHNLHLSIAERAHVLLFYCEVYYERARKYSTLSSSYDAYYKETLNPKSL